MSVINRWNLIAYRRWAPVYDLIFDRLLFARAGGGLRQVCGRGRGTAGAGATAAQPGALCLSTDLTRRLGALLAGSGLAMVANAPAMLGGAYRIVRLVRRKVCEATSSV